MPKTPRISPDEFIRILKKIGFHEARQVGSHKIFLRNGIRTTVPCHKGEIIHPKIIKTFVNDIGLSMEEFIKLV